jgi:probable HAF family extracellular repeat protein
MSKLGFQSKVRRQVIVAACTSLAALLTPSLAHAATFAGLGSFGSALGLSADGSVVVGYGPSGENEFEAFRWQSGTMTGLGDLPGGDFESVAYGVSADGSVVVGYGDSANGFEAFHWQGGIMTGLGDFSGSVFESIAYGVSADGSVIVGYGNSGTNGIEAFRWQDGIMTGLGELPGDISFSEAYGVSADGSVVVGYSSGEAFRWQDGIMSGLGGFGRAAFGVSADGSVIVGYGTSDIGSEAFRWEGGTMIGLGDLAGGSFSSLARGVSADGSVVVGVGGSDSGAEAFIWQEATGMLSLQSVLTAAGADLTGWHLRDAAAVSPDGLTVVGYGLNPSGQTEAWKATLGSNATPVPTPALLPGLAGMVIAAYRKRKLVSSAGTGFA